jgi:hypothetical protein
VEPQEYDELLRTLVQIAARQDLIHDNIHTCIQERRGINEHLTAAIERLTTAQGRSETRLEQGRGTLPETYRQRHIRLHAALNELLGDYMALWRIQGHDKLLTGNHLVQFLESSSVRELLEWSYRQTQVSTDESEETR